MALNAREDEPSQHDRRALPDAHHAPWKKKKKKK